MKLGLSDTGPGFFSLLAGPSAGHLGARATRPPRQARAISLPLLAPTFHRCPSHFQKPPSGLSAPRSIGGLSPCLQLTPKPRGLSRGKWLKTLRGCFCLQESKLLKAAIPSPFLVMPRKAQSTCPALQLHSLPLPPVLQPLSGLCYGVSPSWLRAPPLAPGPVLSPLVPRPPFSPVLGAGRSVSPTWPYSRKAGAGVAWGLA